MATLPVINFIGYSTRLRTHTHAYIQVLTDLIGGWISNLIYMRLWVIRTVWDTYAYVRTGDACKKTYCSYGLWRTDIYLPMPADALATLYLCSVMGPGCPIVPAVSDAITAIWPCISCNSKRTALAAYLELRTLRSRRIICRRKYCK